jgi:two-component system chemotaxis response regulator CheB
MSSRSRKSKGAPFPGAFFDVVGIAASAGGLGALTRLLAGLPAEFPAAIVIVQHLDPRHRSLMAEILNRNCALPVKEAEEGDRLIGGAIFIAPPNRHLLVNANGTLSLSQSEQVHRPSDRTRANTPQHNGPGLGPGVSHRPVIPTVSKVLTDI